MYSKYMLNISGGGTLRSRSGNEIQAPSVFSMKHLIGRLATGTLSLALLFGATRAADSTTRPVMEEINKVCPISGQPVDPKITLVYEGRTYAFASDVCRVKFNEARAASLYQKIGGKPALDAVVESFYVKVLADARIKHFFDDVNMTKQRRKQKEFLAAALGGPIPWTGKDLRKAHEHITGLTDEHFNAVAENLQKTLVEFKVKPDLIDQVMAIAASTRDAVLNRQPAAK